MFGQKKETTLDLEIKRIEEALTKLQPGTAEYERVRTTLEKLEEVKRNRKTDPKVIAAIVSAVGSLIGICSIALIENKGLIFRSKGFGLLPKGRG